ncbi:hypothetical protein VTN77DRAFT_8723 [Rasamsonia byssochlamydoides]|uniref:uncharacterized protein n=1 Tax=Rasamsonia byssochlamydoides TaxID=89139 RepID=UPI003742379C
MPLIILTGYPCSGLTYRAHQLAALLESAQDRFLSADDSSQKPRYKIHVVPSHDSSHPRTVYDNARTEKEARAVVFARVKRALGRDSIVLVDGMNYIKGWRYQLWCEAKAAGTTCCVVHVGTPIDTCVAINNARLRRRGRQGKPYQDGQSQPASGGALENEEAPATAPQDTPVDLAEVDNEEPYPPDLLNNLIFRYEEPSTHSRWDKPLFTVPWSDASPPVEDIFTAITGIAIQKPTTSTPLSSLLSTTATTESTTTTPPPPSDTASIATATTSAPRGALPRPKIKPHQATVQPAATDHTALYSFEKRTSSIVSAIRAFAQANPSAEAALAQSPDGKGITIPVPESSIPVFIPAHIAKGATTDELGGVGGILALPRLQRLRRQWIGLNRAYVGQNHGQGKGALRVEQVGDAFVRFLNAELAGESVVE